MSVLLYKNGIEKRSHLNAVKMLAGDFNISEEEITNIYEIELEKLNKEARIKDFLSVLVIRRVKEILLKKAS